MPQDSPKQKRVKSEYNLMLVMRRRLRPAKACYPCRRRKVKCNLSQPCESCNIRGHPDLCDYTTPLQANASESSKSQLVSNHEDAATTPAEDISIGLYVNPVAPYDTKLYLGPDSLPSLLAKYESLSSHQQH
ncbi:hypothetical protein V8C34DRAFT_322685 [Trichoderma compactum]